MPKEHEHEYVGRGERPTAEDTRYALELLRTIGPVAAAKHVGLTRSTVLTIAVGLVAHRGSLLALRDARERDERSAA